MRLRAVVVALAISLTSGGCRGEEAAGGSPARSGDATIGTIGSEELDTAATTGGAAAGGAGVLIDWQPCGASELTCATVPVPLDHHNPGGPTIDIALVRRAATERATGSIFVNPGGPGGSGVEFVRSGFAFDSETAADYDLIGFDPRGVGASSRIGCELDRTEGPLPDSSPDSPAEATELDADARTFADACARSGTDLLDHLDTESVARDLDLLRQYVGDPTLHYYGFSYGTLIGLVYADLFPSRVGHMVLDGVVDPTHTLPDLLRQQTAAFDAVFGLLDEACGTDLMCPDGGVAATYDRVMAALEADGPVGEVGPAELEGATLLVLYDDGLWPRYVQALAEADLGSMTSIELLSDSFTGGVGFATYAAVECSDSPHPEGTGAWDSFAADLATVSPRFGPAIANELRACAYWPVEPAGARSPIRAPGARPILVVGSTNDVATPIENARRVATDLDDARLITVEGNVHTSYRASACVRGLVAAYFTTDIVPDGDVSC